MEQPLLAEVKIVKLGGSNYVNDFIDRGRVKPVYLQSDKDFRMQPEDLDKWHVRNASGDMVPLSSFASSHWTFGSARLERFNGSAAVDIQGAAAVEEAVAGNLDVATAKAEIREARDVPADRRHASAIT